jgi:hypothetical protein
MLGSAYIAESVLGSQEELITMQSAVWTPTVRKLRCNNYVLQFVGK